MKYVIFILFLTSFTFTVNSFAFMNTDSCEDLYPGMGMYGEPITWFFVFEPDFCAFDMRAGNNQEISFHGSVGEYYGTIPQIRVEICNGIAQNGCGDPLEEWDVSVRPDGEFEFSSNNIPEWYFDPPTGTYTLYLEYRNISGSKSQHEAVKFHIQQPLPKYTEPTGTITVSNFPEYKIDYSSYGINFNGAYVDQTKRSVTIFGIDAKSDSQISLSLPRDLIDAELDGVDVSYVVELDDVRITNFKESKTETERVLTINLDKNVEKIDIIGTHVVPEFPLVIIILVISIMMLLIMSKKYKLSY